MNLRLLRQGSPDIRTVNQSLRVLQLRSDLIVPTEAEMEQIYTALGKSRKFTGWTALSTPANWSLVDSFSGYAIWKHAVTAFANDAANYLRCEPAQSVSNNALPMYFQYKGVAVAESGEYFDHIFYDEAEDGNFSAELGGASGDLTEEQGESVTIFTDTSGWLYIGHSTKFGGAAFSFRAPGSGITLSVKYYNGSAWQALTAATDSFTDNTLALTTDGTMTWEAPADWAETTVNSVSAYWVKLDASAMLDTPLLYQVAPLGNVINLLQPNYVDVVEQRWGWCYYNGAIYVAIPANGATAMAGITFLQSNCTAAQKTSFFSYENVFYLTHAQTSSPGAVAGRSGSSTFNGASARKITHNLGHTNYLVIISLTADPGGACTVYVTKAADSVDIITRESLTTAFDYRIEEL